MCWADLNTAFESPHVLFKGRNDCGVSKNSLAFPSTLHIMHRSRYDSWIFLSAIMQKETGELLDRITPQCLIRGLILIFNSHVLCKCWFYSLKHRMQSQPAGGEWQSTSSGGGMTVLRENGEDQHMAKAPWCKQMCIRNWTEDMLEPSYLFSSSSFEKALMDQSHSLLSKSPKRKGGEADADQRSIRRINLNE